MGTHTHGPDVGTRMMHSFVSGIFKHAAKEPRIRWFGRLAGYLNKSRYYVDFGIDFFLKALGTLIQNHEAIKETLDDDVVICEVKDARRMVKAIFKDEVTSKRLMEDLMTIALDVDEDGDGDVDVDLVLDITLRYWFKNRDAHDADPSQKK